MSDIPNSVKYNPETGLFFWSKPGKKRVVGTLAGHIDGRGYVYIGRNQILAHRLAWFLMTGEWPREIDHINGIRHDNRWVNLRAASRTENCENRKCASRHSKTGLLGVSLARKKYAARIKVRGRVIRLGRFDTAEEAHKAYLEAKVKYHAGYIA